MALQASEQGTEASSAAPAVRWKVASWSEPALQPSSVQLGQAVAVFAVPGLVSAVVAAAAVVVAVVVAAAVVAAVAAAAVPVP